MSSSLSRDDEERDSGCREALDVHARRVVGDDVPTMVTLERTMTSITEIAKQFFEACETGKGWEGCKA
jgi:hypothetical protein